MFIEIKFDSDTPIYLQIRNEIVLAMAKGVLKEGDSLPSVRQMSSMIEVNLHTINKAYNLLKSEGYVTVDRRTGVIVSINKKEEFTENFDEKLGLILSEGFLMGLTKEVILEKVSEKFGEFSKEG